MSTRLYAKEFSNIVQMWDNLQMGLKCGVVTLEPDKYKKRFQSITGYKIELEQTELRMVYNVSLINKNNLEMSEFEKLVRQMREKQSEFFKTRSKEALQSAKVLERSVDAYLLEKNKVENQSKLNL